MWYVIVGLLSGALGAMGMGGGTILIPMLITFFSVEQKSAQFINLVSFVFMAAVAVILHKKNNLINFGGSHNNKKIITLPSLQQNNLG